MIDMRIKKLFFDRPRVERAIGGARRQLLSRAGAFIRQTAKRSMRKARGPAPPGQPPHVHEGSLKRFIYFGYDPATDSVVIGPVKFRRSNAPHLLEFGGTVVTKRPRWVEKRGSGGGDAKGRFTRGKLMRLEAGSRLRYEPRPYMGPALRKEASKLPKMWRNAVRGG